MQTVSIDALMTRDDINCRKTGQEVGIEALAASILAHDLLSPIGVRPIGDGKFEVVDGNRRVAAIRLLRDRGQWTGGVDAIDLGQMTDSDAKEVSLAANIIREDIHPIDKFEVFADLAKTMKVPEIAEHFGKSEKEVRQHLALGSLHPELRALWRAGEIRDDTAKAFTLCSDQEMQLATYNKLIEDNPHQIWASHVRTALGVNVDATAALQVVGVEAYEAAGGAVTQDLFGDGCVLSDPDLAKRLLGEKIQEVCAGLVADGWGWARPKSEIKDPWGWPRIEPSGKRQPTAEEAAEMESLEAEVARLEALEDEENGLSEGDETALEAARERIAEIEKAITLRRYGPRQKKQAGCFVYVLDGEICIDHGRVDPKSKAKPDHGKERGKDERGEETEGEEQAPATSEAGKINSALALALSEQLTKATHDALSQNPNLALCVAIAALEARFGGPAKIHSNGAACVSSYDSEKEFPELLASLWEEASGEERMERLAKVVAQSLDLRDATGSGQGEGELALLRLLNEEALRKAALDHFDANHYFKSVKADLCHAALDEMGFAMAGGRPTKKADLAVFAAKAAGENGWLPIQLRPWESAP